jgi:hypothetical protein
MAARSWDLFSAQLNHCDGSLTNHKGADTYEFDGATKRENEPIPRIMSDLSLL